MRLGLLDGRLVVRLTSRRGRQSTGIISEAMIKTTQVLYRQVYVSKKSSSQNKTAYGS